MIDLIKYAPFSFRDRQDDADFKCPNFNRAASYQLQAAGNTIRFKCPRHSSRYGDPAIHVKNKDCIDGEYQFFSSHNNGVMANNNWLYNLAFTRGWDYLAAWFTGDAGTLSLAVSLYTREEGKAFSGASFFHPRSLEYALTSFLNTKYGFEQEHFDVNYQAPLNWTPKDHLPVVSVAFDVAPDNETRYFAFPITPHHIVLFSFYYIVSRKDVRQAMQDLADEVINSVSVELNGKTQDLVDKVKAECPDMALTKTFAPLKWPMKAEDIDKDAVFDDAQHTTGSTNLLL